MSTTQATLLLFDLAVFVLVARVFGKLAVRLGQPAVVGEIVSGILLGAIAVNSGIAETFLPADVRPLFSALANVGVAVFMFLIGLELDRTLLRGRARVALTLSLSSVLLPFLLGTALAFMLATRHHTGPKIGFVLYVGAALSVTAFPVLVRILRDRGWLRTQLGTLACACAALADVLAWSLLAVVVAISQGTATSGGHWRLALALPYLAVMLWVVRPLLRRHFGGRSDNQLNAGTLALVLIGMLLSAAATEWLGLHFIFGAFLFGVVIPRDGVSGHIDAISSNVGRFNEVLLLPVFFVTAGLQISFAAIDATGFAELGLILVAAVAGKFGGTLVAARAHGIPNRQSAGLAALMNTRGLTELIILTAGRQLGLLDDRLYTLMVIMALVTTAMTGPLLNLIRPDPSLLFVPAPVAAVAPSAKG